MERRLIPVCLLLLAAGSAGALLSCDCGDDDETGDDDDTAPVDDDATSLDDDTAADDDSAPVDDDTVPPPEIAWVDCDTFFDEQTAALVPADVRCGTIPAPFDRDDENSVSIDVRFAIAPCTGEQSAGMLAVELGGPDPNLRNLTLLTLLPDGILARELRERFDLLFVEARGSATSSTPLVCPDTLLGRYYSGPEEYRALVRQCLAALPTPLDPAHMSTIDSVDDLDLVRAALGLDQLRLFGNSYGSRYMLEYIRRHGAHVPAYLLDSTLPPESTCRHDLDRNLRTLSADCNASASCHGWTDDLWSDTARIIAELADDPLPAVDAWALTEDLFHLGDATFLLRYWAGVVYLVNGGNRQALSEFHFFAHLNLPARTSFPTDGETFQFDPYSDNVLCIDHPTWYETDVSQFVLWRLSPPYVPFVQQKWMSRTTCEELAAIWETEPAVDRAPVVSDLPGLLIAPRFDDATPWPDARDAIAHGLSGATLVKVNADHSVLLDIGRPTQHLSPADQQCLRELAPDWLEAPFDPFTRRCVKALGKRLDFDYGAAWRP